MSRQTRWIIETPQALEGMQNLHWKGEHPFFVPLASDTGDPLWAVVPFDFVRRLLVPWSLDIRFDCGWCGTGLYVLPVSPWVRVGTEESEGE